MPNSLSDIDFFEPATNECPYPAYARLRDEAPVWLDPSTGQYVITRYDDLRAILLDTERFSSQFGSHDDLNHFVSAINPTDPERAREQVAMARKAEDLRPLYEEHGVVVAPHIQALDDPKHMQVRRLFDVAYKREGLAQREVLILAEIDRLLDSFLGDGRCEFIRQFAIPLPLAIQMFEIGLTGDDVETILVFADSWLAREGLTLPPDEMEDSVRKEIAAQQCILRRIEEVRRTPDATLLSHLVHSEVPELGRRLDLEELMAEVSLSTIVAGLTTTTHALGNALYILAERPDVWAELQRDPETKIDVFAEEALRLETPVQGLLRQAKVDVELHGVAIPAGALLNLKFAAGNRDERQFPDPAEIDLARKRPRSHLAFGVGAHVCLGQGIARLELKHSLRALVARVQRIWVLEGHPVERPPNFLVRSIKELHLGFEVIA